MCRQEHLLWRYPGLRGNVDQRGVRDGRQYLLLLDLLGSELRQGGCRRRGWRLHHLVQRFGLDVELSPHAWWTVAAAHHRSNLEGGGRGSSTGTDRPGTDGTWMKPFSADWWHALHMAAACSNAIANAAGSWDVAALVSSGGIDCRNVLAIAGICAVGPSLGRPARGTSFSNSSPSSPASNAASSKRFAIAARPASSKRRPTCTMTSPRPGASGRPSAPS